ncbi:unnamed protein product [Cyprideis torosa]|uniref:Uncharacterized protein n=1 Tax=Cyprideis torosa TaxID=163714 RepID=A0A7R8WHJ5_9CRUS|nr:unnamed protein product [Cyprideis torosa]CAG0899466.1 unnamed protein product [Cyprideis torosa]
MVVLDTVVSAKAVLAMAVLAMVVLAMVVLAMAILAMAVSIEASFTKMISPSLSTNGMLSVAVLVAAGIAMLEMSEGGIPNIAQRMVPTWWGRVYGAHSSPPEGVLRATRTGRGWRDYGQSFAEKLRQRRASARIYSNGAPLPLVNLEEGDLEVVGVLDLQDETEKGHVSKSLTPKIPETRKECFSAWDCGPYECCVRPITSQNAYCQARKKEGAFCHRASFWADKDREVYFNSCPCLDHYICADLDTQQRCAHPDRLGDRYYIKKLLGHESDK